MKLSVTHRKDTCVDAILKFYFEEGVALSEQDDDIRKRIEYAYDFIVDGAYTHGQIVQMLMRKFTVSRGTAEKDVQRSKIVNRILRAIQIDVQYLVELQLAEKGMALALRKQDPKGYAANHRNKLFVLKELREMEVMIDPKDFTQNVNVLIVQLGTGGETVKLDLNNLERVPEAQRLQLSDALKQYKDEIAEAEILNETPR